MWFWLTSGLAVTATWLYLRRYLRHGYLLLLLLRACRQEKKPTLTHVRGCVYSLTYLHEGQEYMFYLPIRQDNFQGRDVYVDCQGKTIYLNQEPGVPYLVRASDFDPQATILVCSEDDPCLVFRDQKEVTLNV